ncbi:MAG: Rpn family recombination-promoting nuclease/putative transposase [Lachnospiraceae bacterium]|nr:Rpn family recombination-promoting nuclease/putative transposase [Lachnospiraceae bacterium]
MAQRKKFQDLNLNNAYLFAAALGDEETCHLVLELILGRPIGKLSVTAEKLLLYSSDFRCVRLDIFAKDDMEVNYNLEMQNQQKGNLPKRSRYHQAEMDATSLKPGKDFNDLKPSVIVFICSFDPFEDGLYRYSFEKRCIENNMRLEDETAIIFLNTKGKNPEDVPKVLIDFLNYIDNSTDEFVKETHNDSIQKLHDRVKALKRDRRLEGNYMYFEELLRDRESIGREEGKAEGRVENTILKVLCKKDKNLDVATIAEHLEEPEDFVMKICTLKEENPQADAAQIYELLQKEPMETI